MHESSPPSSEPRSRDAQLRESEGHESEARDSQAGDSLACDGSLRESKSVYPVAAGPSLTDTGTRVLKAADTFAVFNRFGDIQPFGAGEQGLYHDGTRYLSRLHLRLGRDRFLLLSSSVRENNLVLSVNLMNPDTVDARGQPIAHGTVHVNRSIFLRSGVHHERISVTNYGIGAVDLDLVLEYGADFVDLFEVRGTKRPRRGQLLPAKVTENQVSLEYLGLDEGLRRLRLCFDGPGAKRLTEREAVFSLHLGPQETRSLSLAALCEEGTTERALVGYEAAFATAERELSRQEREFCEIGSSNDEVNVWIRRSLADLRMMITEKETGPYPYAGVPWFSTSFGRDGIITALQALWVTPELARGVLRFLAQEQAQEFDGKSDAEPGKILHETRSGEMARLGEIPFGRYYGSIDSTPLFVLLAAEYFESTGDRETITALWPAIERALGWIDRYGDRDGDGFVEYARQSEDGLEQQGWKDSQDSVFHADGAPARGPIALCEVQGYVYAAKRGASLLAQALGHGELSTRLAREAQELRERFDKAFWCDDLNTYALALDGEKRPCRVRTSNAGHCLFTGIALPERAPRIAEQLLSREMFSGWGVRTLATSEARYNPMAYHNGSVWPHDNALVADGLARYGFKDHALRIVSGLFHASLFVDLHRLPELFCGFERQPGDGPTLYPVACAPQAWAAAAVCLLLRSCLGLSVHARERRVEFDRPVLPEFIDYLSVRRLRVGEQTLDLEIRRYSHDVAINLLSPDRGVRIAILK